MDRAADVEGIEAIVDGCLQQLSTISDDARAAGEELVGAVIRLHTSAVRALVDGVRSCAGDDAVRRAADDPSVGSVLALHDLHPVPLEGRVEAAVALALETFGATGFSPRLLAVDGAVARVEVVDAGHALGCNGPTRGSQVEAAVLAAVPDLAAVDVVSPVGTVHTQTWLPLPRLRADAEAHDAEAHDAEAHGAEAHGAEAHGAESHGAESHGAEACELCGTRLTAGHEHGVDVDQHRLVCLCQACRLVLAANADGQGRFRALPTRVVADPEFADDDGAWEALGIPVSIAFFFHDSVAGGIVAFYPSPAGATESLLGDGEWAALAAASPVAAGMRADTEAMLVRRSGTVRDTYLVPIDLCYALVGLLRTTWRGFDGGQEAHDAVDAFFAQLSADSGTRASARAEVLGRA